ncbi:hypothetical protein AHMF7605_19125 [Adhaeribacter arboris]|uniref:Stress-response A/B barrel domain-containing protein n=1 Tax=Adhaeribacter arboris TaxID=2072846 RepID=A0A2T2YIY3_9BACT|nr:Dabb family protein [Adhaeribacter arboris]PSR55467.1 hypothetical protein AHMF7605_19125 [Adhaeribacter arboris]
MNKVIRASLALIAFSTLFFVSAALIAKKEQVRHVVIFKFKPTATPEQIAQVTQELGALKSKIPGIVAFEHGINDSPEKKNLGFTHVYLLTFENAAARDTYLPHPEHKKFGQLLGKLGIMEDVFVVDYAPEAK